MRVLIQNRQRKLKLKVRNLNGLVARMLQMLGFPDGEISLLFVSDARMRELNRRYRKLDQTTDVLSFPLQEFKSGKKTLGLESPRSKQRGIFDPKPPSLPQSPQLAGEPRRANINKLSSARFEEPPQLAGGFFQGEKPIRIRPSNSSGRSLTDPRPKGRGMRRAVRVQKSPLIPLGDVVISIPMALKQAQNEGRSADEEILTLLIHGVLHLVGYDHETSLIDEKRMRKKEMDFYKAFTRRLPSLTQHP